MENTSDYISIVIAEDFGGQLLGFKQAVEQIAYCKVVGLAQSGEKALEILDKHQADILITDIRMPGKINGIELSRTVKEKFKNTEIIIITSHDERHYINQALEIGIKSILFKSEYELEEIKNAIDAVCNGKEFYSPTLLKLIKNYYTSDLKIKLIPTEKKALSLIAQEYTSNEIAEKMFVTIKTVEKIRKNLFKKFGVKKSVGLVLKAKEMGYIS